MQRETFDLEKRLPSVHLDSVRKYLQIPNILIPDKEVHSRLIVRHPDLRPSNVSVSDDYEITSLIDWQDAVILPMFPQSGVPDLDNLIDSAPNCLETPRLPDDLLALDEDSRPELPGLFYKRQLHHLYMIETSKNNPMHYQALTLLADAKSTIYHAPPGKATKFCSSQVYFLQSIHGPICQLDLQKPLSYWQAQDDILIFECSVQGRESKDNTGPKVIPDARKRGT